MSQANPSFPGQSVQLVAVSKNFGETVAVKELSLQVEPGEFLFLLGPSGSGKTTLLRLIAGYEQPSSGRIRIGSHDVTRMPVHHRNIGMVFQNFALFPHMTVAQNVAFGLKMRRTSPSETARKVAEALELVELDGLAKRYPSQLSGGQQQRVALARAIVYRPELLLLDEPLANLDRRLRDNMRFEIKRLQSLIGITTIMVTHDQEESLSMADRIAVLHQGRLEQVGSPAEIYTRPASPFVAAFIGEMNVLRGEVLEVSGSCCRVLASGLQLNLQTDQPGQAGQSVIICLRAERINLTCPHDPASNDFSCLATIEFVTFLGASTLYLVRPENSPDLLKVIEPNATGTPLHARGEPVRLNWSSESLITYF
ncbi:MAG TPA: ABC transporter ATP-binding protein [Chloroflexia bacterium]|nr:ABC transporter ATP-binding protein [Chloroflexia bacterium]